MNNGDSMVDAIALSSPDGHMSKRARRAAQQRWLDQYGTRPTPPHGVTLPEQALVLRRRASLLREMASRGMKPKAYPKEADKLEAQADALFI